MNKRKAFYLDVVEHDSWSGASRDGLVVFLTEDEARDFIKEAYKDRKGTAPPEFYINYEIGAYVPIGEKTYNELILKKKLWIKAPIDLLK